MLYCLPTTHPHHSSTGCLVPGQTWARGWLGRQRGESTQGSRPSSRCQDISPQSVWARWMYGWKSLGLGFNMSSKSKCCIPCMNPPLLAMHTTNPQFAHKPKHKSSFNPCSYLEVHIGMEDLGAIADSWGCQRVLLWYVDHELKNSTLVRCIFGSLREERAIISVGLGCAAIKLFRHACKKRYI